MAIPLHGTPAKYKLGCRCTLCVLVHENPSKASTPGPMSVPTGKTRTHIRALRDAGWSFQEIADRSGYHINTLRRIENQTTLWTSAYTAEDICAIPVEQVAA